MSEITEILLQIEAGGSGAKTELLPLVYEELRRLATAKMKSERFDHTLQGTALVHETYLRLFNPSHEQTWSSKGHFFAAAAEAMRRILIEHARQKHTLKRGGDSDRPSRNNEVPKEAFSLDEMLDFDEALDRLEASDPQAAQIVKLRVFAGLTVKEAAAALEISARSAYREWAFAQAWLLRELNSNRE